jgi:wobble nucleotide-excising tRNase
METHKEIHMDLKELAQKKADLERRKERLLGQLEATRSNLNQIDTRLRDRGIEPNTLNDHINQMKIERAEKVAELTEALQKADEVLTRIESRISSL